MRQQQRRTGGTGAIKRKTDRWASPKWAPIVPSQATIQTLEIHRPLSGARSIFNMRGLLIRELKLSACALGKIWDYLKALLDITTQLGVIMPTLLKDSRENGYIP